MVDLVSIINSEADCLPLFAHGDVDMIVQGRAQDLTGEPVPQHFGLGTFGMGYYNHGEGLTFVGVSMFRPTSPSWSPGDQLRFLETHAYGTIAKGAGELPYHFFVNATPLDLDHIHELPDDVFARFNYEGVPVMGKDILLAIKASLPEGHYTLVGHIEAESLHSGLITLSQDLGVPLISVDESGALVEDGHPRNNLGKITDGRWPSLRFMQKGITLDDVAAVVPGYQLVKHNPDDAVYGVQDALHVALVGVFYNIKDSGPLAANDPRSSRSTDLFGGESQVMRIHYKHPAADYSVPLNHVHGGVIVDGKPQILHLNLTNPDTRILGMDLLVYRNSEIITY